MPASLKDLRSKIKSVKGTQQITKAMKLVSAAKFGRAQHNVVNSRPYAHSLAQLTSKIAGVVSGGCNHPLMNESSSKVAAVLVISSERGLCGGYNANVTKHAIKTISELESEGYKVVTICIGKKALQTLSRRRKLLTKTKEEALFVSENDYCNDPSVLVSENGLISITAHFDKPTNANATRLSDAFGKLYSDGKIGKFVVVYNKFQSAMSQTPTSDVVLPLHIGTTSIEAEPIFEPEVDELISFVIPRYMASRIFQTLLEAVASEHGARMTAMDNATRNAKEMERKLQITYQRARQAAITKELIEIISGAEAL
ncbi:F0F1 ATP synthase subunit gamma [Silvanigrella paludirubra]|jgi:F-type H+-transporting ATPase subunit gamma|uniref:ATP synthase gamma chain n=1 Tax=Silvanigrella paludirubra TaxID=2499159 RepID=A0A6N6VVY1_9BACT|nr:FoF1 ATP synthase subunit gamma [Silvanigrella paludirubra]KAB8038869.1 F0F1 ATP synthase subunit gamma [Silvanigrella paludirubra]